MRLTIQNTPPKTLIHFTILKSGVGLSVLMKTLVCTNVRRLRSIYGNAGFATCERGEKVNLPEIEFRGNSLLLGYYVRVN